MNEFFWATNLRHLRKRKKFSQDELATQLSITRSKLNAHENGLTRNPTVEDLLRFSAFFRISIDSLLKVDLTRLSELKLRELEAGNDVYATGTSIRVLATTVNGENKDNIELVPVKAKAGYVAGYGDPDFISQLPVFSLPNLPQDRKYRMFPTTGDSMYPVPEGAFIIGEFVEDWKALKAGTPCIVIIKNEGIVFKLVTVSGTEKNLLQLESLNSLYHTYEVAISDVLEVWRFRNVLSDRLPDAATTIDELARSLQELKTDVRQLMKKS
jgi:transcriptional regulator with XRE-family HTH domain